jgi:hypothetical protein
MVASLATEGIQITLSFAQSQILRQLWFVAVAVMIPAGAWRLGSYGRQFIQSRRAS